MFQASKMQLAKLNLGLVALSLMAFAPVAKSATESCSVAPQLGSTLILTLPKQSSAIPGFLEFASKVKLGAIYIHSDTFAGLKSPAEVRALITSLRARMPSHTPLIVVDQEGGMAQPLGAQQGFKPIPTLASMANSTPDELYKWGVQLGSELKAAGIDWTFAPIVDVAVPGAFIARRERAMSGKFERVGALTSQFIQGIQSAGIAATAKHYPGHGSVIEDSHQEIAPIHKSWSALDVTDLVSFKAAIKAKVASVMVGHLQIDGETLPATLSRRMVQERLRGELGFSGLIVTDELTMKGVLTGRTLERAAIEALLAGNDGLTITGINLDRAKQLYSNLCAAAAETPTLRARVDQAASQWRKATSLFLLKTSQTDSSRRE